MKNSEKFSYLLQFSQKHDALKTYWKLNSEYPIQKLDQGNKGTLEVISILSWIKMFQRLQWIERDEERFLKETTPMNRIGCKEQRNYCVSVMR